MNVTTASPSSPRPSLDNHNSETEPRASEPQAPTTHSDDRFAPLTTRSSLARSPSSSSLATRQRTSLPPTPTNDIEMVEIVAPEAARTLRELNTERASDIASATATLKTMITGITQSLETLTRYHGEAKILVASLKSPAMLTSTQKNQILVLEDRIRDTTTIKQQLEDLLKTMAMPPSSAEKAAARNAQTQGNGPNAAKQFTAICLTVAAMAAKNAAWYLPALAVPPKPGSSVSGIDVLKRTGVALAAASGAEYTLATIALEMNKNAGGQPNKLAGVAQGADAVFSLGTQLAVNHLNGQPFPPLYQYAGFVGAGLGGIIQTGALNHLAGIKDNSFSPIEGLSSDERQNPIAQSEVSVREPGDMDAERGDGPLPTGNPEVEKLKKLFSRFPDDQLKQMEQEAAKVVNDVLPTLQKAIFSLTQTEAVSEPQEGPSLQVTRGSPADPHLSQEAVKSIEKEIGEITVALGRCSELLKSSNDPNQVAQIEKTLKQLAESVNGSNARQTMFFAGLAAMGALGAVLGAVGSVEGESPAWLANKNNRAMILAVASTVFQAFANWGQFMGGAKPNDPLGVKLLKVGLDEKGSKTEEFLKNLGRALRFLWAEFLPLQGSQLFSEKGAMLAGKEPTAPANNIPSAYTVRNVQEAFRAILSQAVLTALGSKAGAPQVIGILVNIFGALATVMAERFAKHNH